MKANIAYDIMTTDVISVHPDDDVEKVAELLLKHHISGLPVLDDDGKLVGVVTEGDLVFRQKRVRAPLHVVILDSLIYLEKPQRFMDELKRTAALRVGDLMTKKLHTVGPDASLQTVATKMVEKRINRIPVIDADGKLLGLISRQDIVKATFGGE